MPEVSQNRTLQEKSDREYMDHTVQGYKDKLETLDSRLALLEARHEKTGENQKLKEEIDLLGRAIETEMDFGEYSNSRNQIWKHWNP